MSFHPQERVKQAQPLAQTGWRSQIPSNSNASCLTWHSGDNMWGTSTHKGLKTIFLNVPRLRFDPQAFIFGDILVRKGFEVKDHKKVSLQYFFLTVILLLNTAVEKREGFWVPGSPWSVYHGLFLPPPCHCVDHNSKNNFFIPVYIESPSSIAFFALRWPSAVDRMLKSSWC